MTVKYVSQLRGTRCRSLSSDVIARASRRKQHHGKVGDDHDVQEFDATSSSAEYIAGFRECLSHVQRFLADQATSLTDMSSDVAPLSQLLVQRLNQFVADARRSSQDRDRVVRSSQPSPDTTLVVGGVLPSGDSTLVTLASTSSSALSSAQVRQNFVPQYSGASQTLLSVGHNAMPSFLLPVSSGALPRDRQLSGDVATVQPSEYDEYEAASQQQRLVRDGAVVVRPPIIQKPSTTSLSSPSISMAVPTGCCICLQPTSSPSNAADDVWRPWRPDTDTCLHCCDVSDASSASVTS